MRPGRPRSRSAGRPSRRDDAPRTELRIVENADQAGAVRAGYAAPGDGTAGAAGDCPDKSGTSPAADPR
ncbi:hypothetical protein BJF79_28845 [Actinomadura sp. CNU-125]|nr:hypothetical protein BJF79_28845 [Actinomadura sp. CNU-125]